MIEIVRRIQRIQSAESITLIAGFVAVGCYVNKVNKVLLQTPPPIGGYE
jgi:hypothetical protein